MAMSKYNPSFISFAKDRMARQGDEIKAWAKSENTLLSQTCNEIIEAAREQP
jgi:hypothetical protein